MGAEIILPISLTAVLLFVLICTSRMLRSGRHFLVVAFFAFAAASCLFSTLYWIAYDFIRPGTWMPFAANEICESALFLLLASSLRAAFPKNTPIVKALLPAGIFAAANTALWIAWSGEWIQDILTGLSLGWALCVLIACLAASSALKRSEWIIIGSAAMLLIAGQTATFFLPESALVVFDTACSVILFAVNAWLIAKTVLDLRSGVDTKRALCLSFAVYLWAMVAMYMSGGYAYYAALALAIAAWPLMLWAVYKEVRTE